MRIEELKHEEDRDFCLRQQANKCYGIEASENAISRIPSGRLLTNWCPDCREYRTNNHPQPCGTVAVEEIVSSVPKLDLSTPERIGKLSIARSYWTFCFNMGVREQAWYLLGLDLPPQLDEDTEKKVRRELRKIPLLSRLTTYHLQPGLVREVLNDIVWEADHASV